MRRCLVLLWLLAPMVSACGSHDAHRPIAHPTGHRDVVIRVDEGVGMGTAESFFSVPPTVVVTGDGTTYLRMEEATTTGIVWPLVTWHASEADLQDLLQRADDEGLLATPPDYTAPDPVSDAGDTTVELATADGTWTHRANALGDLDHDSAARTRLADFVDAAERWAREPRTPRSPELRPTALRVMATATGTDAKTTGPTRAWPWSARVDLADIGRCRVVRDPAVVHALTTREARAYRQGGTTYSVAAAVWLPGDTCDPGSGS